MSAIRQSSAKLRRPSFITNAVAGVAGALIVPLAHRVLDAIEDTSPATNRSKGRPGGQTTRRTQSNHRQPTGHQSNRSQDRTSWIDPPRETMRLVFQGNNRASSKGNLAELISVAQQVQATSPAAAIALMDFLAKQSSEAQGHALAQRTLLLSAHYPHDAAIRSAKIGKSSITDHDGQLTNLLVSCEIDYLDLVQSTRRGHGIDARKLAERLSEVASNFAERGEQKRESSARLILADLYLQLGAIDAANKEMAAAIVMVGVLYQPEIAELAIDVYGKEIVSQTYRDAPDGTKSRAFEVVNI